MSTKVEINGSTYLHLKEAAKIVNYSRDYVAKLARDKKINATQVGRWWFINCESLKNFVEISELEQQVRSKKLSAQRKREQALRTALATSHQNLKLKARNYLFRSRLVTVIVLSFGLFAGVSFHATSQLLATTFLQPNIASVSNFAPLDSTDNSAFDLLGQASTLVVSEVQANAIYSDTIEYPSFTDEEEILEMKEGYQEGIFLLARTGQVRSTSDIENLFSDEVDVEFLDASRGEITYIQTGGSSTTYQFVSVPVRDNAESSVRPGG